MGSKALLSGQVIGTRHGLQFNDAIHLKKGSEAEEEGGDTTDLSYSAAGASVEGTGREVGDTVGGGHSLGSGKSRGLSIMGRVLAGPGGGVGAVRD